MGKYKTNKTLTKIDPNTLKSKPVTISHHAAHNGKHVITAINPVHPLPVPVDPLIFNLDSENFNKEHFEDGINEEDISKGYYVAHIRIFLQPLHLDTYCL